jgi:monofunctional biosynthetic peptidoglycan transglycosylase
LFPVRLLFDGNTLLLKTADKKENSFSHDWESIDNISVNLQKAVIASEDGSFLIHNGFDFKAMQKHIKGMREVGK